MEIKLGKWQKGDMRRIYFNALALGSAKVYAYANKKGGFEIGNFTSIPGQRGVIYDVENEGARLIEKIIGKPIGFDTKFDDVWSAIGV